MSRGRVRSVRHRVLDEFRDLGGSALWLSLVRNPAERSVCSNFN